MCDLQVMASLHVLSLSAGQDGFSVSVPGDGGGRDAASLTFQCYYCVLQGGDLCGEVPSFYRWRDYGVTWLDCQQWKYIHIFL